jgi:type III secretion protein T
METSAELATLESLFTAVALAMPRLLAIFSIVPFFSGTMLTGAVRSGLLLMIALFISPVVGDVQPMSLITWGAIAAKEALIGLMLGLGFGVFIWAMQSVGDLIDFQTGSSNASFFDPVAGHENGPTGEFLGWLVICLFVSAGGLLAMLGVIVDSYRLWPVVSFFPDLGAVLQEFVVREGDTLFQWIVKLASPVLFVLLLAGGAGHGAHRPGGAAAQCVRDGAAAEEPAGPADDRAAAVRGLRVAADLPGAGQRRAAVPAQRALAPVQASWKRTRSRHPSACGTHAGAATWCSAPTWPLPRCSQWW